MHYGTGRRRNLREAGSASTQKKAEDGDRSKH